VGAILGLLERRPELYAINAGLAGVNWYRHHLDELKTVGARQTNQTNLMIQEEAADRSKIHTL
jgi:spore coat polysaccharide biosynthesis protein SpsF